MSRLVELADPERLARRSGDLAAGQADSLAVLAARLIERGHAPEASARAFFVPGRIEILGKHTDYAGGRSLTCATEQGICLVAVERADRQVTVDDLGRSVSVEVALVEDLVADDPDWRRYAKTVVRRVARDFGAECDLSGADIVLTSDLPAAAGMSSSSALVVGLYLALSAISRLEDQPGYRERIRGSEELAAYLGAIESGRAHDSFPDDRGVGTLGGSQDHVAILCATAGGIGQFSYAPVRSERTLQSPDEHTFVVASSGVRARKTGAARESYNRGARAAAALAEIWRRATAGSEPHLGAALAAEPEALESLRAATARSAREDFTPHELIDRLEHFHQESEVLVRQAGDALKQGDLSVLGLVADRSQYLAGKLLGNQIPETVELAEQARQLGAVAASAFGAGFGGAVWALVERSDADEFAASWLDHYLEAHPERAEEAVAVITDAGPPAREFEG